MAEREALTAAYVRQILHYNPETGVFTWRRRPRGHFKKHAWASWNTKFAGKKAGTIGTKGYITIAINQVKYRANRLAWLYMVGEWPKCIIDHKNLNVEDNRWINLREATPAQNQANSAKPKNNTSGFKGVCWDKQLLKWRAYISIRNRLKHLGVFANVEDAAIAYAIAANKYRGEFARIS